MPSDLGRILITGANGHLGRQLIASLGDKNAPRASVRAAVRSKRAAGSLEDLAAVADFETSTIDYHDENSLEAVATGCRAIVHLVGIIKESGTATYLDAHEAGCEVLARAAAKAGVEQIIYLSIVGSSPRSSNACLASKGSAEEILHAGAVPTTVLRVPMVLGPDDYASFALARQARSRFVALVRGGATMQQPIDSRDVIRAVTAVMERPQLGGRTLELGGPERLTHIALVKRAAALYGRNPVPISIPMAVARGFASLMERVSANPPVTPAMLEVLQHDDRVDVEDICAALDLELTPLDQTLREYVGPSD